LDTDTDTNALARCIWATTYGLSVQAAGGDTAEELPRAADQIIARFPG
jgi:hypothetical protein